MHTLKLVTLVLAYFLFTNWLYTQCQITDQASDFTDDFTYVDDDGPSISQGDFIEINGAIYFSANDNFNGTELWKIDGNTNEIELVKDINPGRFSSNPSNFYELNGKLIFAAYNPDYGMDIWESDGTEEGTKLIKDINPGPVNSVIYRSHKNGNVLYFTASDVANGVELWKTDGTTSGTQLVSDIRKGVLSSHPDDFESFGQQIVFSAITSDLGRELWISDGTALGTSLIKDIRVGIDDSLPSDISSNGTLFYFSANDGVNGTEVWVSDGTSDGTVLAKDISPGRTGSFPAEFTFYKDEVYFYASNNIFGQELWKGDADSIYLLKDINPGPSNGYPFRRYPYKFTEYKSKLYFSAYDDLNGTELWVTDGTSFGTKLFKQIAPGSLESSPLLFKVSENYMYFRANDGTNGTELWRTDGSIAGTIFLGNIAADDESSEPISIATLGDDVYCRATDIIHGYELWKYDNSTDELSLTGDINAVKFSGIYLMRCFDDHLYYQPYQRGCVEIFGIDTETNIITSFISNQADLSCVSLLIGAINGVHYIIASDGTNGLELWRSDGTNTGTYMVRDIYIGSRGSNIMNAVILGDKIYFSASDGIHGNELWVSDGTFSGTYLIKDLAPDGENANPNNFVANGSKVFFISQGDLWVTDGTEAGTIKLTSTRISIPTPFKDGVLFNLFSANNGWEPAYSDGTPNGTNILKDIYTGTTSSNPNRYVSLGSKAFFDAKNEQFGFELWTTDGTSEGTVLLKDINEGSFGSGIGGMIQGLNNDVVFSATTADNGFELWKSDGTAEGTVLIKDLIPGTESGRPKNFVSDGEKIYFVSEANSSVNQIWSTDGTDSGTMQITNFSECNPYFFSNNIIRICGGEPYFVNTTGNSYAEIYKVNCDPTTDCVQAETNIWDGPTAENWNQTPFYWDQKKLPTYCDDIVIPAGKSVKIDDSKIAMGRTLDVQLNASLETLQNAILDIISN